MVINSSGVYSGISGEGDFSLRSLIFHHCRRPWRKIPSVSLHVFPLLGLHGVHRRLINLDKLGTSGTMESKAPERIRFSTTARLFISLPFMRLQKSYRDVKLPPVSRSRITAWNEAPADVLDGHQSEPDAPSSTVNRSAERFISGGSRAMPRPALTDVAEDLVGVIQHAGQQRCHISRGKWHSKYAV